MAALDELDGRIGQGWGGLSPNGSHVNVVLARRGSVTAAAMLNTLALPSPGHTPVLICVGASQQEYEPVWPPTVMINKNTARDEAHETMTWGAAQLGIGQGVLDGVADGRSAGARLRLGQHDRDRRDRGSARQPQRDPRSDRGVRSRA
jgi:formaldehyde-activating enzyme